MELEHTVINKKVVVFRGSAGTFFLKKICWLLLTIITFGIFGLWIKIKTLRWQFSNTFLLREGEEAPVNLSSLKGTVQKKENKTVLYIILGIFGLIVLIVLFKILSFFGPSNPTIEEEMKTVAYNAKEEIMTNGINPDDDLGRGSMMKKIEKLHLNSLDEFNKNHGKGLVEYYVNDENYGFKLSLLLRKKSTVCIVKIDNYDDPDMECMSSMKFISKRTGVFKRDDTTEEKVVSVNY